ncbi:hypothetical protein CU788_19765 [Salmonella enterica]|nr:hypothetical protein [Salmonella enterica]EGW2853014.1 hypothetical protein [Salmonella enterica]
MLGECKNQKKLHATLEKWRNLGEGKILVHTLSEEYLRSSKLAEKKAEEVFSSWDVISCSLINVDKLSKKADDLDLRPWEHTRLNTGLFFEIGLILSVPPQNILGTHAHDVWFPNHAGTKNGHTSALTDAIFSGKGKRGGEKFWPAAKGHSYNRILTPKEILSRSDSSQHNEILVIGRKGVNIYPGYSVTGRVRVTGIICASKSRTGHGLFSSLQDRENKVKIEKLKNVNGKLDVIYI